MAPASMAKMDSAYALWQLPEGWKWAKISEICSLAFPCLY